MDWERETRSLSLKGLRSFLLFLRELPAGDQNCPTGYIQDSKEPGVFSLARCTLLSKKCFWQNNFALQTDSVVQQPWQKGTLFGAWTIFSGAATKKRGEKELVPPNNRDKGVPRNLCALNSICSGLVSMLIHRAASVPVAWSLGDKSQWREQQDLLFKRGVDHHRLPPRHKQDMRLQPFQPNRPKPRKTGKFLRSVAAHYRSQN